MVNLYGKPIWYLYHIDYMLDIIISLGDIQTEVISQAYGP